MIARDHIGGQVKRGEQPLEPGIAFFATVIAQIAANDDRINWTDLMSDRGNPVDQPCQRRSRFQLTRNKLTLRNNMCVSDLKDCGHLIPARRKD